MINRGLQLNNSQLESSFNSLLEKHLVLNLPNQPNPNPIQSVIERGNPWIRNVFFVEKEKRPIHKRLLVNVCKKNLVLQIERWNLWSVKTIASWMFTIERGNLWKKARTKCKNLVSPEHRDTASSNANKFNFAIDEENIDFNISGVPNAMVKRSHGINVHNLIQQIENHLQRQALQSDLQQHRALNPFSKESKDAITAAGNTELCEIVDVGAEITVQSMPDVLGRWHRLLHVWTLLARWYNRKQEVYLVRVGSLLYPRTSTSGKGRPHGHRYGKKEGCKEFHTAKQLQKRCRKKQYENIHDRFIRDTWFRKTMIELGRSEAVFLEMDRLASEDHSHIATEE